MDETLGLFPIPFMRAPADADPELVRGRIQHFAEEAGRDNNPSPS